MFSQLPQEMDVAQTVNIATQQVVLTAEQQASMEVTQFTQLIAHSETAIAPNVQLTIHEQPTEVSLEYRGKHFTAEARQTPCQMEEVSFLQPQQEETLLQMANVGKRKPKFELAANFMMGKAEESQVGMQVASTFEKAMDNVKEIRVTREAQSIAKEELAPFVVIDFRSSKAQIAHLAAMETPSLKVDRTAAHFTTIPSEHAVVERSATPGLKQADVEEVTPQVRGDGSKMAAVETRRRVSNSYFVVPQESLAAFKTGKQAKEKAKIGFLASLKAKVGPSSESASSFVDSSSIVISVKVPQVNSQMPMEFSQTVAEELAKRIAINLQKQMVDSVKIHEVAVIPKSQEMVCEYVVVSTMDKAKSSQFGLKQLELACSKEIVSQIVEEVTQKTVKESKISQKLELADSFQVVSSEMAPAGFEMVPYKQLASTLLAQPNVVEDVRVFSVQLSADKVQAASRLASVLQKAEANEQITIQSPSLLSQAVAAKREICVETQTAEQLQTPLLERLNISFEQTQCSTCTASLSLATTQESQVIGVSVNVNSEQPQVERICNLFHTSTGHNLLAGVVCKVANDRGLLLDVPRALEIAQKAEIVCSSDKPTVSEKVAGEERVPAVFIWADQMEQLPEISQIVKEDTVDVIKQAPAVMYLTLGDEIPAQLVVRTDIDKVPGVCSLATSLHQVETEEMLSEVLEKVTTDRGVTVDVAALRQAVHSGEVTSNIDNVIQPDTNTVVAIPAVFDLVYRGEEVVIAKLRLITEQALIYREANEYQVGIY